jgi:peptidyl-tRNA hydrolase
MASRYDVKQVIVLRTDIDYKGSKGKMLAMAAHCSLAPILRMLQKDIHYMPHPDSISYFDKWCEGSFAKIVCKIEGVEKILSLQEECKERYIPCAVITDNATTVFNEPTIVGIGIGPYSSEILDEVTGGLQLF